MGSGFKCNLDLIIKLLGISFPLSPEALRIILLVKCANSFGAVLTTLLMRLGNLDINTIWTLGGIFQTQDTEYRNFYVVVI